VAARDSLQAETARWAARLADAAPSAVTGTKVLLKKGASCGLRGQLEAEKASFLRAAATADFKEALNSFFERRPPQFTGS
jgi:2-(1,2-epoxy-1,2-dihydrophenyl)acetyl-CoA isomerase